MFFDSKSFKSLESGLRAAWLQQQVTSQNLSNYETPNYKAKKVEFSDIMNGTMENNDGPFDFQATISSRTGTFVRPDGNNVDSTVESTELWKSYAQMSYLTQKINGQFNSFRYVLTNAMK